MRSGFPALDRHRAIPVYYQIHQHLLEDIRAGKVKMEPPGSRPPSQLISSEVLTAEAETGEALHLSPGENLIRIGRVRLADALPMPVDTPCLPQLLCANLLDKFDPRTLLPHAVAGL